MNELDEIWQQMIQQATAKAKSSGRSDVADYLSLKASNDQIRSESCRWLFNSFLELSEESSRHGIRFDVENENPHRYQIGHSTMVGSLLRFRQGVRTLTVEAGWTRTPGDGFMRGNSLAHARISHFGMSKSNAELLLLRHNGNLPEWFLFESASGAPTRKIFSAERLREHFGIFIASVS